MLPCEWLSRLITVDKNSGIVTIRRLIETQAHSTSRYEQQSFCSSQTLSPSKFNKYLKCVTVLDSCSGWTSPHLLVTHATPHSGSTTHELLVCNSNGSFEECGLQFEVAAGDLPSEKEREGEEAYHLLDGPTVLWKRGAVVYIVHGPRFQQVRVTLQKPVAAVESIRKMWCVQGRGEGGQLSVLLMMQLQLKDASHCREFGEREWKCLEVKLKVNHRLDFVQTEGLEVTGIPHLIPADYGYIASCIALCRRSHIDERSGVLQERVQFLVGTEYQQVVLVEEGSVKQVISLEHTPQHLVPLKYGDNTDVAVTFPDGTVRVCDVTESGHKDKGTWTDVMECLTGDFAQLGHDQLLILPKQEHSGHFYLRDTTILSVIPPSSSPDQDKSDTEQTAQDPPESLLNVLKAFQLKKHTVGAQLIHHQLTLQHKYGLLSKGLQFVESLARDDSSFVDARTDATLVCLVAGKTVTQATTDDNSVLSKKPPLDLRVLRMWQRVLSSDGTWVVAVLLRNDSQRTLTDVRASLLVESGHTLPIPRECSSRVVWREPVKPQVPPFLAAATRAASSSSPPGKRLKLEVLVSALECPESAGTQEVASETFQPNQAFCVGVVTEGVCPGVEAAVCGSWRRDGDSSDEVQTGEWARVHVDTRSLCTGELSTDEQCLHLWDGCSYLPGDSKLEEREVQDLACLLAARSLTQVLLHTDYTYLSRLPSMIRARLPLPTHALQVSGSSLHRQHHPPSGHTPSDKGACKVLEGIALHVQLQREQAVVSILHRTLSDLKLILKLLKEALPDDIHFSSMSECESSQQQALWQSLSAIRAEGSDRAGLLSSALEAGETTAEAGAGGRAEVVHSVLGDSRLALATDAIVKTL